MQRCWEVDSESRPTFAEIVSQYHCDGLVSETFRVCWVEKGDYALLGPETENKNQLQSHEGDDISSNKDDSDSLLNAILTHFQKTPPASFTFNTFVNSGGRRETRPMPATKPDLEYYIEMGSSSAVDASVFVNQSLHEYDVISIDEEDGLVKSDDHMTSSTNHVTEENDTFHKSEYKNISMSKSNSDYILMQSAESAINQRQM